MNDFWKKIRNERNDKWVDEWSTSKTMQKFGHGICCVCGASSISQDVFFGSAPCFYIASKPEASLRYSIRLRKCIECGAVYSGCGLRDSQAVRNDDGMDPGVLDYVLRQQVGKPSFLGKLRVFDGSGCDSGRIPSRSGAVVELEKHEIANNVSLVLLRQLDYHDSPAKAIEDALIKIVDGGYIYIEFSDVLNELRWSDFSSFDPRRRHYFTPLDVARLIARHGLGVEAISTAKKGGDSRVGVLLSMENKRKMLPESPDLDLDLAKMKFDAFWLRWKRWIEESNVRSVLGINHRVHNLLHFFGSGKVDRCYSVAKEGFVAGTGIECTSIKQFEIKSGETIVVGSRGHSEAVKIIAQAGRDVVSIMAPSAILPQFWMSMVG